MTGRLPFRSAEARAAAMAGAMLAGLMLPGTATAQKAKQRGAEVQRAVDAAPGLSDGPPTPGAPSTVAPEPRPIDNRPAVSRRPTVAAAAAAVRVSNDAWDDAAHGKAAELIRTGQYQAALTELDRVEALVPPASLGNWKQSLGMGADALRGIALHKLGKSAEGDVLFARIEERRGYSASYMRLLRSARLFVEHDPARQFELIRNSAALEPSLFKPLFWFAVMEGRFADALQIAPHVSFDLARSHGGWTSAEEHNARYEAIAERGRFEGSIFYLLTVQGQPEAAAARLAEFRKDIAEWGAPPSSPNPGLDARYDYDRRKGGAAEARELLAEWEGAIALRATLKGKSLAVAEPLLPASKLAGTMVLADLLRQIAPADAFERAKLEATLARWRRDTAEMRESLMMPTMASIVELFPDSERYMARPNMRREGGWLGDGNNGFKVSPDKQTGLVHVRFGSTDGSRAMVEEAAMTAAANYARSKRKDSFVLTSFSILKRSTTIVGASGYDREVVDSGFEVRLTIRLVDSAAPPADLTNAGWRLIRVDPLIAKLSPVYAVPKS